MPRALVRVERSLLTGETLRFMQRLWDLVHALDVRSKRMAKTLGVTGPQRLVLRVLGRSPAMAASDIAETMSSGRSGVIPAYVFAPRSLSPWNRT